MTTNITMGLKQWLMLLILSLLWGGSFFFMKVALLELPTFSIVLLRVSLAAFTLFVYLKITNRDLPTSLEVWRLFFYLGFFNNIVPFSLLIYGMTEIASGLASILNATTPLFTIVVAHFATADERISASKIVGIVLGMLGVSVLIGVEVFSGISDSLIAMLACLGAAISYAVASVIGRGFKRLSVPPSVGAFGQVFASSLLLLPLVLVLDSPWQLAMPSFNTVAAIFALGTLSTAIAYVLFFRLIEEAGATNAVLVTLLVPVSAILLGWIILNEQLSSNHFLGMLCIGLGLIAIDGRVFNQLIAKVSH
ncbi:MAG: DMT family transporter [Oceanospirillaceae bacterium]